MSGLLPRYSALEHANERIRELEQLVQYLRSKDMQAPNNEIAEVFHRLNIGAPVGEDLLEASFHSILTNPKVRAREFQLGAFLAGLGVRGPTPKEVACLVRTALRDDGIARIKPTLPNGEKLICVAGSGKKGHKTINISTPASLAACAAGAFIAKPCSTATSSITGSRDFLQLVGANMPSTEEMVDIMLATGFGAFSIEALVPKLDAVYGGRVYCVTPLSFALPAMINPIVCDSVYYGLSHPDILISLETFRELGFRDVMVVTSSNDEFFFIDELTPLHYNYYGLMKNRVVGNKLRLFPENITSAPPASPRDLQQGRTITENVAHAVTALRSKHSTPYRDAIGLNAGALLMLAGKAPSLADGFKRAVETISSGQAYEKLVQFVEATQGNRSMLDDYSREGP